MTRFRHPLPALAVLAALMAGACGPDVPLEVAVRDYSTDIVYGEQTRPSSPPPIPGANPDPGFPGFIVPPPPARLAPAEPEPGSVPAPPAACPADDPLDFPDQAASRTVSAPPAAGIYTFRQQGAVRVGERAPQPLPATSEREVVNAAATSGDLAFDVRIEASGETTTTSYAVRQATGDPGVDGVFLTRVVTRRAGGGVDEFSPARGVRLLALPAAAGVSWRDVGTDPIRATSMVVEGTVVDKARVNACGTPLDAWTVKVTGRLLGPAKDLAINATYQIGTQFGGFVIADDVAIAGADGGVRVELRSTAVVNNIEPARRPSRSVAS